MKKFYSMLLCASVALSASAQTNGRLAVEEFYKPIKAERFLQNLQSTKAPLAAKKIKKAAEQNTPAPETLVGKSFVLLYNDNYDDLNGFFTGVENAETKKLTLEGFAGGYDVEATYDAATGKITIPAAGVVIATHSTYGDIMLYALNGNNVSQDDIVGTWDGEKFVFDRPIGGLVNYGGSLQALIMMTNTTAIVPNAKWTFKQATQSGAINTLEFPLVITKTGENQISVVGLSNLMYGYYLQVPFSFDETAKTATLPFGTVVDKQYKSTGYVDWILGGFSGNYLDDLVLNIATTEDSSTLTVDKSFYGYHNGQNYSGYTFTDNKIEIDYNVFTAEADIDYSHPVIGGIKYEIPEDSQVARVIGCDDTLTDANILGEIEVQGVKYPVTSVAANAFKDNGTIKSITIPASIKTVETDAFRNVKVLTNVNIADLKSWCAVDFANGNANPIYNVFSSTIESKWGTVNIEGKKVTTTLEFPEGIETIGRAFYGFKSLTDVTLPESLKTLGDQVFANCTKIESITIPANVETIGSAFFGCSGLKNVDIKADLKALGNSTFYNCALDTITLPANLESIGSMTFSGNKNLTGITLPASMKSVGMMAFYGCSGIKSIISNATEVPEARSMAFEDVDTTIPVYVPVGTADAYKAANEWKNFTNYVEKEVSGIEGIATDNDDNAAVEYFNLQGVKIANPAAGQVVIRRQGSKTTKMIAE